MQVLSMGQGVPLEKEVQFTIYSILAWKIPWTEELVRLQSMGSQRAGHDLVTEYARIAQAAAAAESLQSCPTLCDPIDSSPIGSSVPGIL